MKPWGRDWMAKGLLAVGASSAARTIDAVLKHVTSTEPTAIEIMGVWWRTVCSPRSKIYYVTIRQRRHTIQERIKMDDKRSTPAFPTMRIELCELRYSDLLVNARIYFCSGGIQALRILQEFGLPCPDYMQMNWQKFCKFSYVSTHHQLVLRESNNTRVQSVFCWGSRAQKWLWWQHFFYQYVKKELHPSRYI